MCALSLGVGSLVATQDGCLQFQVGNKLDLSTTNADEPPVVRTVPTQKNGVCSEISYRSNSVGNSNYFKSAKFASVDASVRTPFTNEGDRGSVYYGQNKALMNWYGGKIDKKQDNYSKFSKGSKALPKRCASQKSCLNEG